METPMKPMTALEKIRRLVEVKEHGKPGNATKMTLNIGPYLTS